MSVVILAIESSCDDTSAAVIRDGRVLSNCVANQEAHRLYGGVVPELASRAHQANIIPVVDRALKEAGVAPADISAAAFTRGPGLLGSLLVGISFAKGLALGLQAPLIEVDHMQAHILAHFIDDPKPPLPFLCLTVSGGHTQIAYVRDYLDIEIIGRTLDDAAGEAFDKAGKMLGLDYPAGPLIDRLAASGTPKFDFPEPAIAGLNFSFSGLKTSILYFLRDQTTADPHFIEHNLPDLCASIQDTIARILIKKLHKAARETGIRHIAIAGGVSANSGLRRMLEETGRREGWTTYVPAFQYCTDNAAMIGMAAWFKYQRGLFTAHDAEPYTRLNT